jgi:hypothetical protein
MRPSVLLVLGLVQPIGRRIARALLATLLLGFFIVRFAIRQYVRKELIWRTENPAVTFRRARQK